MSRVARAPVKIPAGVEVRIADSTIAVKGPKGELAHRVHDAVSVAQEAGEVRCKVTRQGKEAVALAGTTRAVIANMVTGVSAGFEKRLNLVGVGYRAQMRDGALHLALGFSHPVEFAVPEGIAIETPSQTEIVVRGIDRQQVGQTAAVIRDYRPPEPYKGKGVKYSNEVILRKEAKKK